MISDLDFTRITSARIAILRRAIPHMSTGIARYAATIVRLYDKQGAAAISVRDMFFAACVEADAEIDSGDITDDEALAVDGQFGVGA